MTCPNCGYLSVPVQLRVQNIKDLLMQQNCMIGQVPALVPVYECPECGATWQWEPDNNEEESNETDQGI